MWKAVSLSASAQSVAVCSAPSSGVFKVSKRGFAENPRDIAKRIASTKSIQKITKSMKMVSAAKLRGDTNRLMDGRAFGAGLSKVLNPKNLTEEEKLPEFKKPLYVMITSDRGLCGGVNSYVAKKVKAQLSEDVEKGLNPKVIIVGDKGAPLMQRTHGKFVLGSFSEPWKTPMTFNKAASIAERIVSIPDIDVVKICYNRFVNSIAYETEFKSVPVYPALVSEDGSGPKGDNPELPVPLNRYEVEYESTGEALKNIFEYGLGVQLYGCALESATSEQSSRMTAMDNASKNASEMVGSLTVKYNRARQARITTELIEIISGAESLKG